MIKSHIAFFVLILGCLLPLDASAAGPGFGSPFPEARLSIEAEPADRHYLGIADPDNFTLSHIRGELVLVEFLNVHCPHCQMQAPSYNELFKDIEAAEESRDKIKMIGIAVGNLPYEVAAFRSAYQVQFPIVADTNFAIWRAVQGEATPYSVYVRQTQPGKPGIVAGTHLGLNTHYRELLQELVKLAGTAPETLLAEASKADEHRHVIAQLFSEDELEYRVRNAFVRTGGNILEFAKVSLRSGRQVYTARLQSGNRQRRLFAEIVSRQSVCDICHDVHFIYIFDIQGQVFDFDALQLTKYGNVNWNAGEISSMRSRLLDKSLTRQHQFNPQVDAISSATITSAIIFDSLNQGTDLLAELKEKGF